MDGKICNEKQLCYAERVTVNSGRAKGADLIIASNGVLNFIIQESNAMDILSLQHKGMNMSFISKNGMFTASPEFLRRFPGGMLYTCGLDAIGGVEGHQLHGNFHTIPADLKEINADYSGILVKGEIKDSALFGQNLKVIRTITSDINSGVINLEDEIINESYRDENYCMLYHINSGYPLVDEGTEISADFKSSEPRTEWAKQGMDKMLVMGKAVDNEEERCYYHILNKPVVSVINKKIGKKLTITYSDKTVPCLTEWKSQASGDYVIGLEPCTSFLDDRFKYMVIKPGEKIINKITIGVEDL